MTKDAPPDKREVARSLLLRGSMFVHLDPREVHYVKVALDRLFGRDGQTLRELCEGVEMTRFGVMKHLRQLEAAGLVVTHEEPLAKKTYDFAEWTQRMRLPEAEREALAAWLLAAPRRCREFFALQTVPAPDAQPGDPGASAARVRSLCATFGILVARKPA